MEKYFESMLEHFYSGNARDALMYGGFLWKLCDDDDLVINGGTLADIRSKRLAFPDGRYPNHYERANAIHQYMAPKLANSEYLLESYVVENGETCATIFHFSSIHDIFCYFGVGVDRKKDWFLCIRLRTYLECFVDEHKGYRINIFGKFVKIFISRNIQLSQLR